MRRKTLNIDELGNEVNTERKEVQMNRGMRRYYL